MSAGRGPCCPSSATAPRCSSAPASPSRSLSLRAPVLCSAWAEAGAPIRVPEHRSSLNTRQARSAATLPQRVDLYFERRPLRRVLCGARTLSRVTNSSSVRWCGISAFSGYYLANTLSLTFGALAVNDIVAAAISVAFVEYASRAFYDALPRACVLCCCRSSSPLTSTQAILAVAPECFQGSLVRSSDIHGAAYRFTPCRWAFRMPSSATLSSWADDELIISWCRKARSQARSSLCKTQSC